MRDFVDQEYARRDRELAGALKCQIGQLQIMRWLLALVVVALCAVFYWLPARLQSNQFLLFIGIGAGLVGGLHLAALRLQPPLRRAVKRLEQRTD